MRSTLRQSAHSVQHMLTADSSPIAKVKTLSPRLLEPNRRSCAEGCLHICEVPIPDLAVKRTT